MLQERQASGGPLELSQPCPVLQQEGDCSVEPVDESHPQGGLPLPISGLRVASSIQ